ncbi:MAG: glycerophosphodiester phosphodiesterase [Firmicutes bacterium]|nr:glycerophosphodiester phosphodiesterase [Bacillota bacterium]
MVRIVAHRGGRQLAVENTLAAFQNAVASGCDGVEIDMVLSRDGHLMAFHDDSLQRMTGVDARVWDLTAHELGALSLRTPEDRPLPGTGEGIHTLDTVAAALPSQVDLVLDTKHDDRECPGLSDALVRFCQAWGAGRVSVLSVHHDFLRDFARRVPEARVLFNYRVPVEPTGIPNFDGRAGLAVGMRALTPAMLVEARTRQWPVYLWTPNTGQELEVAMGLGVSHVITDAIDVALAQRRAWAFTGGRCDDVGGTAAV